MSATKHPSTAPVPEVPEARGPFEARQLAPQVPPRRVRTRAVLVGTATVAALVLTGCAGGDDDSNKSVAEDNSPEEALALAKTTLDETSGVKLKLTAEGLPSSVSGIVLTEAEGVAMHPASFAGSIVGSLSGITQDGEVIAVDGTVWVKIALLGNDFQEMDPASIGAPDPGQLIATDGGLSDLLVSTEDVAEGDSVRGGDNNDEVLTEYTGTLAGDDVTVLVPSASGDSFDVTYQVAGNGELRTMEITGVFYAGTEEMSYVVSFSDYGTEQEITAP